jgi:hypothetical protein
MKYLVLFITVCSFSFLCSTTPDKYLLKSSNSGTEFYFSIPPSYNESGQNPQVKVLVTSAYESEVTLQIESRGIKITKSAKENSTIEFLLGADDAEPVSHNGVTDKKKEATIYQKSAIHVTSEKPIIVYVIIQNGTVTEGFMALPIQNLGNEYFTMAYNEPNMGTPGWFSPFTTITATENNTSVKFTMGGDESSSSEIALNSGASLEKGESIERILNKGDVWVFSINGKGQDLSGSIVESTKPVAVVSGVNCAMIPEGNTSCNYIVEMELPTNLYGKNYFVTPSMFRSYNGIVKVYAKEDNTGIYRNGQLLDIISEKGEYLEFRLWDKVDASDDPITPKLASISSNKDIAVVYYNPGTREDFVAGNQTPDNPYMMQIIPAEQFTNLSYFATPNAIGTNDPFINNGIIVTFETPDGNIPDDLILAKIDLDNGIEEWSKVSDLADEVYNFTDGYNGKSIGSVVLNLSMEGNYILKSESNAFSVQSVSLGGNYSPYGFPSGGSFNNTFNDNTAPSAQYLIDCNGNIVQGAGVVFDYDNGGNKTSNLKYAGFDNLSNYELEIFSNTSDSVSWSLTRIDSELPASAKLIMIDNVGNMDEVEIEYIIDDYSVSNNEGYTNHPNIKTYRFLDTLHNQSEINDLYVMGLSYSNVSDNFKYKVIEPVNWDFGDPIPPKGALVIESTIEKAEFDDSMIYSDTLFAIFGFYNGRQIAECEKQELLVKNFEVEFPKYKLESGNKLEDIENENAKIRIQDTLYNLSSKYPLYVSNIALKYGDKGFTFDRIIPNSWAVGDSIHPNESIIIEMIYDPSHTLQTDEEQTVIDSLGIEISAHNVEGILDPIAFEYLTEQKTEIKAKTESSVKYESSEYDIIVKNNQLILEGDYYKNHIESIKLFDIEGNKIIEFTANSSNSYKIQNIASGIYLVAIEINDTKIIKKIILTN